MKRLLATLIAVSAMASDWTAPVEVRHEDELSIAYQARLDGDMLLVRATLGPGWHTFAMDNKRRVDEKLAGKPAISNDRPTEILASGGLQTVGGWYQSPPKDFSHPELRWFSWGFEGQALFAAKVRRAAGGPTKLALRGQACTASVCKNIDLAITLPAASPAGVTGTNLKELVLVR
jgi:DsbC/DsbD-like thiol-disulfide interchange protein